MGNGRWKAAVRPVMIKIGANIQLQVESNHRPSDERSNSKDISKVRLDVIQERIKRSCSELVELTPPKFLISEIVQRMIGYSKKRRTNEGSDPQGISLKPLLNEFLKAD
ncbi:Uncharacterized protein Fot_36724 [Forsythia ovata]|uniref:Uncharacterized protein n=1 Tax=Forsythia ovata TaxID=205694 RepID=A0ABD1SQV2_9LAMI